LPRGQFILKISNALFYYDYYHTGGSRSQALQKAQKDLRTMTGEKLKNEYYQQLNQHLQNLYQQAVTAAKNAQRQGNEDYQKYQQTVAKIAIQINTILPQHCQEKCPFVSPFYWAGFISQGLA
jgi:CHAT domain-containing protein